MEATEAVCECSELKMKVDSLQRRLDEALSEVAVAGCVRENLVELQRQKGGLAGQLASLEALLTEATASRTRQEHEVARVKAVAEQLEVENRLLKQQIDSFPNTVASAASMASSEKAEAMTALSDVTKSLARRVKSNLQNLQPQQPQEDADAQRAFEDAEALRAIVVPLEEQIGALKDKLRTTDSLLREAELRNAGQLVKVDNLAQWLKEKSLAEAMENLDSLSEALGGRQEASNVMLTSRLSLAVTEVASMKAEKAQMDAELEKSRLQNGLLRRQAAEANGRLLKSGMASKDQKTQEAVEDMVIAKADWNMMQAELQRLRSLDLEVKNEKLREELKVEAAFRKEVEEQWNTRAEASRVEVELLQARLQESEGLLRSLRSSYSTAFEETRASLFRLREDREAIVQELKRLQAENDDLIGKHEAKSEEMQNEVINLPESTEDMQLLLLTYRQRLVEAKLAAEHHEEKRLGEGAFLKAQIAGEQQAKEAMEEEVEGLKERLLLLESCRSELEAEQKRSRDLEAALRQSRQETTNAKKEVEAVEAANKKHERALMEMRSRVGILQQELDNSVAVQTDFVRLSQSLQMELEKIRQAEKEVRWQHEDDVDDCSSCRQNFTVGRRKHHCRHCGRVFCADCLTKSVASGPNMRPAKVCEVCHTLLVQNSAPYFSTEAPHVA